MQNGDLFNSHVILLSKKIENQDDRSVNSASEDGGLVGALIDALHKHRLAKHDSGKVNSHLSYQLNRYLSD